MSPDDFVKLISGTAGAIVVLVVVLTMIVTDKLHTDGEFKRILAALETEKTAHNETRKALAEASARADAAVKASEIVAEAMSAAGDRRQRRRHERSADV